MTIQYVVTRVEKAITDSLRKDARAAVADIHRLYGSEKYVNAGGVVQELLPNQNAYNTAKIRRGGDPRKGHDTLAANRYFKAGSFVTVKGGALTIDMDGAPEYVKHYLAKKAPGFGHISTPSIERIIEKAFRAVDRILAQLLTRRADGTYILYED